MRASFISGHPRHRRLRPAPRTALTIALSLVVASTAVAPTGARAQQAVSPPGPATSAATPGGSPAPQAQDTEACFEAAEAAQPLMRQNRLRAARLELAICVRESCPRVVRSDCGAWLASVDASTPTVRLAATEMRGGRRLPLESVRVLVDGDVLVAAHLDDQPRAVDPGTHVFHFERAGGAGSGASVDVRVTVPAGAKAQRVEASFGAQAEKAPVEASTSGQEWLGYLLGSAGVVALGAGIYFEASGLSARGHLDDTCKAARTCLQSDVDSARNRVLAGDLLIGGGIALLGSGAFVLLTSRGGAPRGGPSALRFDLRPLAGGVGASLGGAL